MAGIKSAALLWTLLAVFCLPGCLCEAQINKTAEYGQTVTLPCQAPNNIIIIVVQWSRDKLDNKYVLSYRAGQVDLDKQHPSFKNRVDLQDRQMKDGDASLILRKATAADAGTYECRILTAVGVQTITVKLNVPPVQINVTAGATVILPCEAPRTPVEWIRSDPQPENDLTYWENDSVKFDQHLSVVSRLQLQDQQMTNGDVSLILKNVMVNDTGTYECRVPKTGGRRRKRSISESEPINVIKLRVDPGPPGGAVGLTVGLSVSAVLLLVAAVVGFLIYRKRRQPQDSYQPPAEQPQTEMFQL